MNRSIKRDAVASYSNLFITIIIALILVPIVESHVGKNYYGIYQFIVSLTIYSQLMSIGLGKTIERYVAKYAEERKENLEGAIISIVLSIYIVTSAVFFLGMIIVYWQFGNMFAFTGTELEVARVAFIIATLNAGLNIPTSLFQSHLRGRGRFFLLFNVGTVKIILKLFVVIAVLRAGYGIIAVFAIELVMLQTVNVIFAAISIIRYKVKIQLFHFDKVLFKKLFKYTTFVFLSGVAHTLYWNTDNIILGVFTNAEVIAEYALSQRLIDYFYRYGVAFSGLFMPKFMEYYMIKDLRESNWQMTELFTQSSRVLGILMSFAVVNFIVLGKDFVELWIGPQFHMTYVYTLVILIPYWLILAQYTGTELLYAMKKHKIVTWIYLGSAVINIFATVYLVNRIGPIGAALSTGVTLFIGSFIMTSLYFRFLLKMDLLAFMKEVYLRNALVSIIALLYGFILNHLITEISWLYLIGKGMLMNLVFVPLIFFLLLKKEEREKIIHKIGIS